MTPEEFSEKMQAIFSRPRPDLEMTHLDADNLMCEVLKSLGYGAGVEIFHKSNKWYA